MCLSVDNISSALTDKTKAVLYVNAYGNTDEIDKVEEFLNLRNIYLINDSAPALNCQFKGRPISSFGAFSILSFYADKTISTGEGGALLTDDQVLVKESNMYKHDGRKERGYDIIDRIGFNFRMTEMQAAVGIAQLKKLDEIVSTNRRNKSIVKNILSQSDKITFRRITDEEGETIPVSFHGDKELKNIRNGTEVRIIGGHIYNDNLTIPEDGKVEVLSG